VQNLLPNFSHIYLENAAIGYSITDLVLSKFPKSKILKINHYKDIFNRTGQDFQTQKTSMKLILSKKPEPFIYPASDMIQEYSTPNAFYNTPLINCLYNCDYCFLQGMYQSGNLVLFVNDEDFMDAISVKLNHLDDPQNPMIVSISYNTDILAMENIIPLSSRWINYARNKKNLFIEIRTKSALFSAIKNIEPSRNVILSWTLSPQPISEKYEHCAPPLDKRLSAVKQAIEKGWEVRLCFDPVIIIKNWYEIYCKFFDKIFMEIDTNKLKDITLGVFRMNKDYFNRIRKRNPKSDIYYQKYSVQNKTVSPDMHMRKEVLGSLEKKISQFLPKTKILKWE